MTSSPNSPRRHRGHHGSGARGAVQAAVSSVHTTRPAADATAVEQALWWHQRASALDLIAQHEADTARAEGARADADVARRLSRGLGLAHASSRTDDASAQILPLESADAAETAEPDAMEVGWP